MNLPSLGEVHLWHLPHRDGIAREEWLTPGERARAAAYRFPVDQARYRYTQSRVREILARYLARTPAQVQFESENNGKPKVTGLEFNLSHSRGLSLLVISGGSAVGIDLESIPVRPLEHELADKILTPREHAVVQQLSSHEIPHALLRIWTAKEAYLKALGTGLMLEPHLVECHFPELSHAESSGYATLQLQELTLDHAVAHLATENAVSIVRMS